MTKTPKSYDAIALAVLLAACSGTEARLGQQTPAEAPTAQEVQEAQERSASKILGDLVAAAEVVEQAQQANQAEGPQAAPEEGAEAAAGPSIQDLQRALEQAREALGSDEVEQVGQEIDTRRAAAEAAAAGIREAYDLASALGANGDGTPCENAYASVQALAAELERRTGGQATRTLPPRDEFMMGCQQLSTEAQRCLSVGYAQAHQEECAQARQAMLGSQRELINALNPQSR